MKKYILAPLCSALVVPGLGQILNEQLKKGLVILSIVFILIIVCVVELAFMMQKIASHPHAQSFHFKSLLDKLAEADFSVFLLLLVLFALVWVYSVLDAWWAGVKLERQGEGRRHEILPDR